MDKFAAIILSTILVATTRGANAAENRTEAYDSLLTKRVSMVELLANPNKYDNKEVCVDGILHNVYEDDTLYLSREMADALIKTNGFGLRYNEKKLLLFPMSGQTKTQRDYFHNKLCAVLGTFNAKDRTLDNITAVWEDRTTKQH